MPKPIISAVYAFLLGASAVLGFAPFYIFPASIASVAGIGYLWKQSTTPKSAWLLGFSYGLGLYCVGIYWIYIALHTFGNMPWWFAGFCTFCLCAFMASFVAWVGYFSKRFGWMLISVPILWGLSDWVRSWIFTGFPWLTLGYSQVPFSPLAGFMPIVGVYGVSVLTAFLGIIIACAWANQTSLVWRRNAIAAIILLLVSGGLLRAFAWSSPIGKAFDVSLVQGNIAQDLKWSPEEAQHTISQYLAMVQHSRTPLIILPETALPVIASQLDPSVKSALATHAKQNQGDVIVGMVEYDEETDEYFNSALSFGSADTQTYRKNHLVPFGEFIPLKTIFGWIYRDWLHMPLSDLSRGGWQQAPMRLAGQAIGVNICYEDVFGEEILRQLPEATLLVNMSNDAWYGKSIAADQHMQFSQARALETGRMVLRATNTGATAAIDTQGFVVKHAPHDKQTTLNISAQGYTGSTPYVHWGNWPFLLISLCGLVFVISRKNK